jgi:hypothetical protein
MYGGISVKVNYPAYRIFAAENDALEYLYQKPFGQF